MVSFSVSNHRGLVYWQGLLLVVSLLNFWSLPTTAQVTVESKDALEGTDVRLRIRPEVPKVAGFKWFRGRNFDSYNYIAYLLVKKNGIVRGPPGTEVMVEDDGTLLLKNVTVKHSGIYTVMVELRGCQKMIACGRLRVYPHVSVPTLVASSTSVTENKDAVVFTCYTDAPAIEWFFNGRSLMLSERLTMSHDHRVITIDPVHREDAGEYQCKGFNPRNSGGSALLKLDVKFE